MPEIVVVNQEEFLKEIKSDKLVLVDFFAEWCGPCRALARTLEEERAELPVSKIIKINIDQEGDLANQYGVVSIPTIMLCRNGQVIKTHTGSKNGEDLKEWIEEVA